MTTYNFAQIEQIWTRNGGSSAAAPMAAAIALAESSGYDRAQGRNPGSSDWGLWQINDLYNGGGLQDWDVDVCARDAIRISGNGSSWRSWCTAFSDGACGTQGGSYLGPGSPYQRYLSGGSGGSSGGHPTLSQGASGPEVRTLQQFLSNLGFDPGPIDGQFGAKTKAAVVAYQRAHGLAPDGVVGPATWASLEGTASGGSSPETGGPVSAVSGTSSGQGVEGAPVGTVYHRPAVGGLAGSGAPGFGGVAPRPVRVDELPNARNFGFIDTAATTGSGVDLRDLFAATQAIESLGR